MAEQTFKSPGFFEREIEIISRPIVRNNETPVGIVGPAEKGPAFVPITVSSRDEYEKIFGTPDRFRHGSHAIAEYFAQGGRAATFCRVLGTGKSAADKSHKYAGFKVEGSINANNRGVGAVHFIAANHTVDNSEYVTLGVFNDNDSITTNIDNDDGNLDNDGDDKNIQLIRAMIFMHKDYYLGIDDTDVDTADDDIAATDDNKLFNLVIKDSDNNLIKKYTVSLDPESNNYIAKVLNTDTFSFESHGHLLYAHFPIDETIASTTSKSVALLHGNVNTLNSFGDFNKRYQTPKTPHFISQPFGTKEYDLFKFESLDDGSYASNKYKISIVNLKASNEKSYKYGTFGVQLRDLNDTDDNPVVYEAYSNLSLDPNANNFIARIIGDQKIKLQLDVDSEDEKRLVREGTFPANSSRIRVVVSSDVLRGNVPEEALPFGFRGIPSILTTLSGKDGRASGAVKEDSLLDGIDPGNALFPAANDASNLLGYSVLPPLFYRAKVTKGNMKTNNAFAQTYLGEASTTENVKTYLYWGLMTTKVKSIDNPNEATSTDVSALTHNLVKFLGNAMTSEGPTADAFNNNKFSLAKVAFGRASVSELTNDVLEEFKNAAYVRNADVGNTVTYDADAQTIKMSGTNDPFSEENNITEGDTLTQRISFAKILSEDIDKFNRFSFMTKFTAPFCGGFDGVNIMNEDDYYFTDRASSNDVGGNASVGGYASGLSGTDNIDPLLVMQGVEGENNIVVSYKNAVKIMTDEMIVTNNVLVIPGIRDSLITDYAMSRVKDYGKAIYLMDIPHYDKSGNRLFNSARGVLGGSPDVDITSANFVARELNSSYAATYFPDVTIADAGDVIATNKRSRRIPSSVVALGALARTDAAGTPWFAPAGFSRGALNNVKSVDVRLSALDRDVLYEARINPIANFPNNQFVIFGQKTTQIARTALDRVNVRRLMIKIKSDIQRIAQGLLFEQNDAKTRGRFIKAASETLQRIRVGQGIEDFRVIMDDTNNTEEDVDNNRLNGKIIVVPTRAVEFIAMDFVITNSGVEFPA